MYLKLVLVLTALATKLRAKRLKDLSSKKLKLEEADAASLEKAIKRKEVAARAYTLLFENIDYLDEKESDAINTKHKAVKKEIELLLEVK